MQFADADTIVAVASGSGRAGVGVIRVSGAMVPQISQQFFNEILPTREACYRSFQSSDGVLLDKGIALRFEAPNSYTGEHVLELQGHGGPVVLDMLVTRMVQLGARLARPGEFSERAFLNGKMDLAQAEAVSDLINSSTEAAALASARSMRGDFSKHINTIQAELINLRVWLEAALDFSEEDIDFLADKQLQNRVNALLESFDDLIRRTEQGQKFQEGLTVTIGGVANAGKSSLLNRLVGEETAIVTDVAGTTRDVLKEQIHIQGVPIHIVDTAGIRKTNDVVEKEGIRRAIEHIKTSDHVLVLLDAENPVLPDLPFKEEIPHTIVINKIDKIDRSKLDDLINSTGAKLAISAADGEGLQNLKQFLLRLAGVDSSVENAYGARRRHLDSLYDARESTNSALERLAHSTMPELAAEELRYAQLALDSILGRYETEDLLGRIFSDFCIGK